MPRKAEYARAFDEQTEPGRRDSQGRLVLNDRDAKDKSALIYLSWLREIEYVQDIIKSRINHFAFKFYLSLILSCVTSRLELKRN